MPSRINKWTNSFRVCGKVLDFTWITHWSGQHFRVIYSKLYGRCLIYRKQDQRQTNLPQAFKPDPGKFVVELCWEQPEKLGLLSQFIYFSLISAYRSIPYSATGFTPNSVMLEREVNRPEHIIFPLPQISHSEKYENMYVTGLRARLEECNTLAREIVKKSAIRQKNLI